MRRLQRYAACVLMLAATWLRAEGLPDEIHIIVPVTAGSSLDARARVIAEWYLCYRANCCCRPRTPSWTENLAPRRPRRQGLWI